MAVRAQGQPYAVTLWLRMMALDEDVATIVIDDNDIGRWGHWKKVVSGEYCHVHVAALSSRGFVSRVESDAGA